jgi:hypothetical protein
MVSGELDRDDPSAIPAEEVLLGSTDHRSDPLGSRSTEPTIGMA